MTPASRTQQVTRLFELLSKTYRKRPADAERPVLENLVFAAVLENTRYEIASRVFTTLKEEFFDWNEVRVSTVRDLADAGSGLPDPVAAAQRVKQALQYVFESSYSFDLEDLQKLPIGQAVERLQKIEGVTRFMVAYVVQNALGGHTIPLDAATLRVLNILGLADESEVISGTVGGLERAIAKSQGRDFAWALHELGAEFWADHRAPQVVKIMKSLDPQSLERLEAWENQKTRQAVAPAPVAEQPVAAGASAASPVESPEGQRKRGRRKKTEPETGMESAMASQTVSQVTEPTQETKQPPSPSEQKRRRGRPSLSGKVVPEGQRRPGRPPKAGSDAVRKRGRKKKA